MSNQKVYGKHVPSVRTKSKRFRESQPVIFWTTIQSSTTETSAKSQTATTQRSQEEKPVSAAQPPHQSNYIDTVSSSSRINAHEKDTKSNLLFHEELQNFEDNQTFAQLPVVQMPVLLAQKDISIHVSRDIQIPHPVQAITNLTWRVQSLTYNVLAFEKRLSIQGSHMHFS